MKKILFIIWSYSYGGGAEALLTTIVNHLNPRKYQIGIIEFYHNTVKKEPVDPAVRIYEPITYKGDPEYHKKLYYVHREPDKMIRKYIPSGYDLYISFNYQIPSFLLPEGARNIAWIHTDVFDLAESGMEDYFHMQKSAFEKAARIVAVSDVTTRSIKELFPESTDKIVEIYNGVDRKKVRERADQFTQIQLEHPALLFVGRLEDRKNPLRMLDIFKQASEKRDDLHLYFLGNGSLEPEVRKKAYEYGIEDRVHFSGYVENPFPVMKQADLCCMTSKAEGFPMSLLESAALGVPFVSTKVGGAEVLSNGGRCGGIYTADEKAVDLIIGLLGQPGALLAEECEKSVRRFDLKNYISRIEKLLDEALEEELESGGVTAWDMPEEEMQMEDRNYYYRFPEPLVSKDWRIILYGAGNVGMDYYRYIQENGICRIAAWVDAAAEKYTSIGRNVEDTERVFDMEYDVILIAVADLKAYEEISMDLCRKGIPADKIIWTKPIF